MSTNLEMNRLNSGQIVNNNREEIVPLNNNNNNSLDNHHIDLNASVLVKGGKKVVTLEECDIHDHEHEPEPEIVEEREQWTNFWEYFLSIIGFVIDLGNVWRFPTVCYQNGGGAFLLPFLICLFLIGMPCMYLELVMGQYFQSGSITIWNKIAPLMKGLGYSTVIINILMLSYYNTLQAYAVYYLGHSFQSKLPWSRCDMPWSTSSCRLHTNKTLIHTDGNEDNYGLSASEFFERKVTGAHLSTGFDDLVGIKWDMLLCLFVVFVMTTGCLVGGIKSSGKAVYVTALLPYVCLVVLIGKSLMLDGAYDGLAYYLTPQFDKLFELQVWLAAAVQTFFSLGPGFGVLVAYSSYSSKSVNVRNLTLMCSLVNCLTSLMYGVVVFAGLGYMAKRLNVDIDYFIRDGIGLVYVVYPEIIATFSNGWIFAVVFFIMLITLGMDSAFGGMETLYTAIADAYPVCRKNPLKTRFVISLIPFLTSLPTVTFAGIYVVQWLDRFAISPSVLIIVIVEVVTVTWVYGLDKFCSHIKEMNGVWPFWNWRISWKYICPSSLILIVALDIVFFENISYGPYNYPPWSAVMGYSINGLALLPIPIIAFRTYLLQRMRKSKSSSSSL